MPAEPNSLPSTLISEEPILATELMSEQGTGWDGVLESMAADLYRIGSMLVGEGEDAIGLVEQVVVRVDLSTCNDVADARQKANLLLAEEAIALLLRRNDPSQSPAFPAPAGDSGPASCIEDDDLDAVGVSPADLEEMISGPESRRLRGWLEGLPDSLRAIFVLRAVAGLSSAEVAGLLGEFGGPAAADWTPDSVRGTFRQGLCSLASQLIHTAATR